MGATILACVAWSFALARGGIARVAPLQFAQPVLALIFAAALLGERVSFASILCGITILAGVVIAWRNASAAEPTDGSAWSRETPSGAGLTANAVHARKRSFFLLATVVNDFAAFSKPLARKLATEIAEGSGRRVKVSANLIDWAPPPASMEKE
jgi:hypothetical protein